MQSIYTSNVAVVRWAVGVVAAVWRSLILTVLSRYYHLLHWSALRYPICCTFSDIQASIRYSPTFGGEAWLNTLATRGPPSRCWIHDDVEPHSLSARLSPL